MRLRPLAVLALLLLSFAALPSPVAAADGLTMEAHTLLDGHARVGSWMAVAVRLKNDGPAIDGELRLAGGAQGKTRFGQVVDLPTQSDKTFLMYTQPPAFGREIEVSLVADDQVVATTKAPFKIHDGSQLAVGVIAERPGEIIGSIDLIPNQNQQGPVLVPLRPEDLPERVEAWGGLDRLIWQDTDSNRLTPAQSTALRGWLAGGGRLILVGGTTGPNTLSAFPDDLLPYRPTATVDVAPTSLGGLLGTLPATATDVPALGGDAATGRVLATSGDRTIAAERPYGNGAVTLVGFDPTTDWIAQGGGAANLWRMALPPRTISGLVFSDDTQLVSAVSQLPALALPPIGGLIALLGAYILLVGPINYLVLRRLDRREWAWVTMPVLIAIFAVGAYAFGSLLRGSDLLVNEDRGRARGARDDRWVRAGVCRRVLAVPRHVPDRACRAARSCRHRSAGRSSAGPGRSRPSMSSRGIPRRCATSRWGSGPCARSAPKRRSRSRSWRPTCDSRTAGSAGRSATRPRSRSRTLRSCLGRRWPASRPSRPVPRPRWTRPS